jgi:CubicO group peptidase (beta-lactamase class C family)
MCAEVAGAMKKHSGQSLDMGEQVDRFIEQVVKRSRVPGIAVAIYADGSAYQVCKGVCDVVSGRALTEESRFDLGSVNQLPIALVALQLVSQGRIDLDAALSRYLPLLAGPIGDRVRVRHLLSHTAGYQGENLADPDVAQAYSDVEFADGFNRRLMLFEPGTVFDESASACVLLARIVHAVTGQGPRAAVRKTILEPLGIDADGDGASSELHRVRDHQVGWGAVSAVPEPAWSPFWESALTGARLRLGDLLRVGIAIVERSSVFCADTVDLLLQESVCLPEVVVGVRAEEPFRAFGLGCGKYPGGMYGARSSVGHQCCALRFDVHAGAVMAIAINASESGLRDFVLGKLTGALFPSTPAAGDESRTGTRTTFELREMEGTYVGARDHSFSVTIKGDGLLLRQGHNPSLALSQDFHDLRFERNAEGCFVPTKPCAPSLAFFRNPASGAPCLQVGSNAFRKMP